VNFTGPSRVLHRHQARSSPVNFTEFPRVHVPVNTPCRRLATVYDSSFPMNPFGYARPRPRGPNFESSCCNSSRAFSMHASFDPIASQITTGKGEVLRPIFGQQVSFGRRAARQIRSVTDCAVGSHVRLTLQA
jgi:hypothetical protein